MKTVAPVNIKGGVAKITSAGGQAILLGRENRR
jgi:hypothetical protein